ncbi:diguanylate cyclase domain-containing protein [Alkalihalobacterium bogoriense]|uniref:diguanylate cyclase domain-containing protein n=1 Tax=Alkalihalobacterium bogoriense TaxID=246272 RepID=UPI0006855B2D|nr:diguanylate cyclase [Alkalihalobacterium bogoriense]
MLASLRQVPNKVKIIIILILLAPLIVDMFLYETPIGSLWFIYLGAVVLTSYYSGLRGGLTIAIVSIAFHFIWELNEFFKFGLKTSELFVFLSSALLQFILAFSIGLLADKLKEKHTDLENIFNSLDATIWSHDLKTDTIIISTGIELLYGYTGDDFKQNPNLWNKVVYPEDVDIVDEMNRQALLGNSTNTEFRIIRPDGDIRWVQDKATPIYDKDNKLVKINGVVFDITERKKAEEKIKRMAYYDFLTDLPNRKFIHEFLQNTLDHPKTDNQSGAVLFLDLDGFKNVNDTFGHTAGDALLIDLAQRILACLKKDGHVGRLGGDEFIIVVEHGDEFTISLLAERLLKEISEPFTISGKPVLVTSSIGICFFPRDGKDAQQLIIHADHAMYKAKDNGKNQYHFYK